MDLVKPVSYSIVIPGHHGNSINLSSIVSTVHYASEPGKTKFLFHLWILLLILPYFPNPERIVMDCQGCGRYRDKCHVSG